jgi:hypothetical protein
MRRSDVIALPVLHGGIVDLEEELEKLAITDLLGVEDDLECRYCDRWRLESQHPLADARLEGTGNFRIRSCMPKNTRRRRLPFGHLN